MKNKESVGKGEKTAKLFKEHLQRFIDDNYIVRTTDKKAIDKDSIILEYQDKIEQLEPTFFEVVNVGESLIKYKIDSSLIEGLIGDYLTNESKQTLIDKNHLKELVDKSEGINQLRAFLKGIFS